MRPSKCYSRSFKDLIAGKRFGAEYYMPCKSGILDALAKVPHRPLSEHARSVREMWDPTQAIRGHRVRNFDLTDSLAGVVDDAKEPELASQIGSAKKRMANGDVIISRLRSYLKEIAVVRATDQFEVVGSSEYVVLRPHAGLTAETLMVFLRSQLVQTVLQWSQDGSNHPRFAEEDLLALPVPEQVLRVQDQVGALVGRAILARREATQLLDDARSAVEGIVRESTEGARGARTSGRKNVTVASS